MIVGLLHVLYYSDSPSTRCAMYLVVSLYLVSKARCVYMSRPAAKVKHTQG